MKRGAQAAEGVLELESTPEQEARSGDLARPVNDAGMATAEYAIATLAACGFAGLLVTILRGDEVRGMLLGIIRRALALG